MMFATYTTHDWC